MADDDVQLTDLGVIQRYSLAVRGATASRADLVATLQADLDWLKGGRRTSAATSRAATPVQEDREPTAAEAPTKAPAKAPAKTPAKTPEKAAKTPDRAPEKAPAKASKAPATTAAKKSTPAKRPAKG